MLVVAPSGPIEARAFFSGLGWLRTWFRVSVDPGVLGRSGFSAGAAADRVLALNRAFAREEFSAVIAARGGYGAGDILDEVDWSLLARAPKWLVGFSDITVLHHEAARHGVVSLHGSNVSSLGAASARARADWLALLARPETRTMWSGMGMLWSGSAEGTLVGGNLCVLHSLAAERRLALPEGAVVLFEDVAERPYRIDRMLRGLERGGHLARAAGFVFGGFTAADPAADGVRIDDVLAAFSERVQRPTCARAPFGHITHNRPFYHGGFARLDASRGELTFGALP